VLHAQFPRTRPRKQRVCIRIQRFPDSHFQANGTITASHVGNSLAGCSDGAVVAKNTGDAQLRKGMLTQINHVFADDFVTGIRFVVGSNSFLSRDADASPPKFVTLRFFSNF
jgi:hypothetical protein